MSESIKIQNRTGRTIAFKPKGFTRTKTVNGKKLKTPVGYARIVVQNGETRIFTGAYVNDVKAAVALHDKIVEVKPELTPAEKAAATKKANAEKAAVEKEIAKELAAEAAEKKAVAAAKANKGE